MPRKKYIDPFQKVNAFSQTILSQKPTKKEMIDDVRMMSFKVNPVQGEISDLDFSNQEFVEVLWSIGKIEDFFFSELDGFKKDDKEIFWKLVHDLRASYVNKLSKVSIIPDKREFDGPRMFEIEIVKDVSSRVH